MQTLQTLNQQFGREGGVTFETGSGGLVRAVLRSGGSEAQVYLHGGHVTHFAKVGERPLLFMSNESLFQAGKAIRGGVPICWPWFGPRAGHAESPMHGFARTSLWTVEGADVSGGETSLRLGLKDTEETRKLWPHGFWARYTVTISDKLTMRLEVVNTGQGPMQFEEALHTYLAISDIKSAEIEGLGGVDYVDKTDGMAVKTQGGKPMRIVEETDRIYLNTKSTCTVRDAGLKRKIVVSKENSEATVVWNPWIAKAKAMADFGDNEWQSMVCIETCNVNAHAVNLAPGASHVMTAIVGSQSL